MPTFDKSRFRKTYSFQRSRPNMLTSGGNAVSNIPDGNAQGEILYWDTGSNSWLVTTAPTQDEFLSFDGSDAVWSNSIDTVVNVTDTVQQSKSHAITRLHELVSVGDISYYYNYSYAGDLTVTLPDAPVVGQSVTVKDAFGTCYDYNIILYSNTFPMDQFSSSYTLNNNYQCNKLVFNGTSWMFIF